MDQPLEIRQLDLAITVLIEQTERLTCLEAGITHLQRQQYAPVLKTDGSILEPIRVNGTLQVVHGEFRAAGLQAACHLLRR